MSMVSKLAFLRRRDHLTATDISLRSGIPLGTLNKIMSGKTKNPTLSALNRICQVFHVPIPYLLDDATDDDCYMACYEEAAGMLLMSQREVDLHYKYRSLNEHDKQIFELLLDRFCAYIPSPLTATPEKILLCYDCIAMGQQGAYADAITVRNIAAPVDPVTKAADFAVRVVGPSLEPVYPAGTLLAVRHIPVLHNQLGVFIVNREGYIRKLFRKREVQKLVAINVDLKTIILRPTDEIFCLGAVSGAIRNYHWL